MSEIKKYGRRTRKKRGSNGVIYYNIGDIIKGPQSLWRVIAIIQISEPPGNKIKIRQILGANPRLIREWFPVEEEEEIEFAGNVVEPHASVMWNAGWRPLPGRPTSDSMNASGGKRRRKTRKKAPIKISCNFDSGNILQKSSKQIKDKNVFTLEIRKDPYPKSVKKKYQNWYYFKVDNVKGKKCKFVIENLVNIDNDWKGHNVVCTYDHKFFFRTSTNLNNNTLCWEITPKKQTIYFSYYVPYCRTRSYKLVNQISKKAGVKKKTLGYSPLRNKIEVLKFGTGNKHIFIIARQHPGETISSWMLEGFITTFFSPKMVKMKNRLLKKYKFHIIVLANPDGVELGHWYTQKNGHNCNREWNTKKCPEVRMISKYMKKYDGCIYLYLHGDEGCDKHFITTCTKTKKDKDSSYKFFCKRMVEYNKNFNFKDYYTKKVHKVHGTFDCAWDNALTIEGCMKHNYNKACVSSEPLKIGKHLFKSIYDWSFV